MSDLMARAYDVASSLRNMNNSGGVNYALERYVTEAASEMQSLRAEMQQLTHRVTKHEDFARFVDVQYPQARSEYTNYVCVMTTMGAKP